MAAVEVTHHGGRRASIYPAEVPWLVMTWQDRGYRRVGTPKSYTPIQSQANAFIILRRSTLTGTWGLCTPGTMSLRNRGTNSLITPTMVVIYDVQG